MAVPKLTRYTVSGTGRFPLDMLRYECSWPFDSGDTASIAATFTRTLPNRNVPVTVTLMSHSSNVPTARWASFGWKIDSVEKVR